jgi:protein-S-isoprenylcysteine O-methyltransferase Ste14
MATTKTKTPAPSRETPISHAQTDQGEGNYSFTNTPAQGRVNRANESWVTDQAWISGLAGGLSVVGIAAWYQSNDTLNIGLYLFDWKITDQRIDTLLAALAMITLTMIVTELLRLFLRAPNDFLQPSPEYRQKQFSILAKDALLIYVYHLILFWLVITFYKWAVHYGFQLNKTYYIPWFRALEHLWTIYLWAGLPYILLTRAFKHNGMDDEKDFFVIVPQLFSSIAGIMSWRRSQITWSEGAKKAFRSLLVKVFFAPLMTVFFCDQLPHLVNNIDYAFGSLPQSVANGTYTHQNFNGDLFNLSISFIFSIDVALAWVGYIVSSRWLDNQTVSAEPTLLGWLVCISCYPPFQLYLGLYYSAPGERDVLNFTNQWAASFFTVAMLISYLLYLAATLCFGVRFSNLTHRGIIRKGPFAIVRHPAYASKNFAWWCVMFPVILYNASSNPEVAVMQIVGLCLMTCVYYWRAVTEERHLSLDPDYQIYCQQVKYRFIPRVL